MSPVRLTVYVASCQRFNIPIFGFILDINSLRLSNVFNCHVCQWSRNCWWYTSLVRMGAPNCALKSEGARWRSPAEAACGWAPPTSTAPLLVHTSTQDQCEVYYSSPTLSITCEFIESAPGFRLPALIRCTPDRFLLFLKRLRWTKSGQRMTGWTPEQRLEGESLYGTLVNVGRCCVSITASLKSYLNRSCTVNIKRFVR